MVYNWFLYELHFPTENLIQRYFERLTHRTVQYKMKTVAEQRQRVQPPPHQAPKVLSEGEGGLPLFSLTKHPHFPHYDKSY